MKTIPAQRRERRTTSLSKTQIVEAAIAILDVEGENALTFRALAARLATGSGAIYWHVADKNELLTAATDMVIAPVMAQAARDTDPVDAIRTLALGVFETVDARPWVGAHLARAPWQLAMLLLFETIGQQLRALNVPPSQRFDAVSTLVSYILGVAGQNAANARLLPQDTDRESFLADVVARWTQNDPAEYPFMHEISHKFREHDDRAQFLAGVNLILAGIKSGQSRVE
ncbi:TetR family transcriptional regulator [Bradyrhizobium sp. R2.2-H]|uniref:TetR/AcrR family transcriptional regulator n=1 Tax=unclassified Bradyrhizobium TaxID=2631580 RepID=UPI001044BDC4|nr:MULTISPECIES: helix-turn-helix domain-containing protein [unclassified Bradyrhizobium]TCU66169.1 TetR family transcriptional regulator [Bradyrhizobium sp. Y-H1]TCU67890.1 TetR family transcriptional regulator [Bradyrhizobium sp. R2.2-H]